MKLADILYQFSSEFEYRGVQYLWSVASDKCGFTVLNYWIDFI